VIRVYDEAGNVIETHQHKGDFTEYTLGSAIVLKESSGTNRYPLVGNTAVYVTRSGKVLDDEPALLRLSAMISQYFNRPSDASP